MKTVNIFQQIPTNLHSEIFELVASSETIKIERIISKGHASPATGWYDQDENEWVMVVRGQGELTFEDGTVCRLAEGDYINIPAHCKHKVSWTDPDITTIWLAVFYK